MSRYIEAKVRYQRQQENGTVKMVTDMYLVDALSFTEAEARVTEEVQPFIDGEFSVSAVKKSNICEVFGQGENADSEFRYFKAKLAFIAIDEKTASEKKSFSHILVMGLDFKDAYDNLVKGMSGTMADYEIVSIAETPIIEILKPKLD